MEPIWQGLLIAAILRCIILVLRHVSAGVEQSATAKKVWLSPGSLFLFVLFVGFFIPSTVRA